jgi:hypothetical protein
MHMLQALRLVELWQYMWRLAATQQQLMAHLVPAVPKRKVLDLQQQQQ